MSRVLLGLLFPAMAVAIGWISATPAPRALREPQKMPAETAVERGRRIYVSYGCAMCHGADGRGGYGNRNAETDGKVPGVQFVKEGYTRRELAAKVLDGTRQIGKADPRGPLPPYRMPGWRDRLAPAEANDLVEYLFSLYPQSAEQKWR